MHLFLQRFILPLKKIQTLRYLRAGGGGSTRAHVEEHTHSHPSTQARARSLPNPPGERGVGRDGRACARARMYLAQGCTRASVPSPRVHARARAGGGGGGGRWGGTHMYARAPPGGLGLGWGGGHARPRGVGAAEFEGVAHCDDVCSALHRIIRHHCSFNDGI